MESSHFGYNDGDSVKPWMKKDLTSMGEYLCQSFYSYSIMLKEIDLELKVTGGWLKPSKLKQFTG